MSGIGVGDLVVCVDDVITFYGAPPKNPPKKGNIYTISHAYINPRWDDVYVRLAELENGPKHGFLHSIFRKIHKPSIEVFRKIAANPRENVDA